jgi:membrane-associated protease RseP (regulator of RpoE activity)
MVYYVQKGTLGSFSDIEKGDILVGVDGHAIRSLEDLYGRLDRSKGKGKVSLRLKRFAEQPADWVFDYVEQAIRVEDLRWISQRTN